MHLLIRVTRGRVFYHRDLVAKLSGITNSCLHTGVCDESHDDELMDAVFLELQIQISIGKTTGAPMLERHDVAGLRYEFAADLAAPRAVFEGLPRPRCLLDRRNVLPTLVVAWTVSTMQRIKDAKLRLPRRIQDLQHMRNTTVLFCNRLQAIPYLASLGNEIVVRIDHQKCGELFVIRHFCHVFSSYSPACDADARATMWAHGIRRHSGRFCRRGECRRILPDELLHAQRPLPR